MADFSILKEARDLNQYLEDFYSLRKQILPEYRNEDLSDPGNAIAQVLLGVADYLQLRADVEASQFILDQASRKSSFKSLLRLMGTDLAPPSAATVDVLLTLTGQTLSEDLAIPKFHPFRAPEENIPFLLLSESEILPAGQRTVTISLTHGTFGSEVLGTADGAANQLYLVSTKNILQNAAQKTLSLTVGGVSWKAVDSLAFSLGSDTHYLFQHEADGTGRFLFGDGSNGAIPANGSQISVTYVIGGGKIATLGPGSVTEMVSSLTANGETLTFTVTNPAAASGGSDEQSIPHARLVAPYWWRAQDRGLALQDYEALARKYPGVLDARSRRTGLTTVTTYVLADSESGTPSTVLISGVLSELKAKGMATDDVTVSAATRVPVDVTVAIRAKAGHPTATVKDRAVTAAKGFFDLRARKTAGEVLFGASGATDGHRYLFDFGALLDAVEGVENLDVTRFTRVPSPIYDLWSGDAFFSTAIAVSNDTLDEEITIFFTAETAFSVSGDSSGPLGTGVLGTAFSSANAEVGFTLTKGPDATLKHAYGDTVRFRVSPLVDNIKLQPDEVAILATLSITVT